MVVYNNAILNDVTTERERERETEKSDSKNIENNFVRSRTPSDVKWIAVFEEERKKKKCRVTNTNIIEWLFEQNNRIKWENKIIVIVTSLFMRARCIVVVGTTTKKMLVVASGEML